MPNDVHTHLKARGWRVVLSRKVVERLLATMTVGGFSPVWARISTSFDELLKLGINLLVLAPICLIGYTVCEAILEDLMIVEAFIVPKALEDQGYGGTTIFQSPIDKVELSRLFWFASSVGDPSSTNRQPSQVRIEG
jgi:hypothetical protein